MGCASSSNDVQRVGIDFERALEEQALGTVNRECPHVPLPAPLPMEDMAKTQQKKTKVRPNPDQLQRVPFGGFDNVGVVSESSSEPLLSFDAKRSIDRAKRSALLWQWGSQAEHLKVVFEPGDPGMNGDDDGFVGSVDDGGQADRSRVLVGMRAVSVQGEPFLVKRLILATDGNKNYTIIFEPAMQPQQFPSSSSTATIQTV